MIHNKSKSRKGLLILSLAALGVVYGDIGTSPLYAINTIFFGRVNVGFAQNDILGGISLVIWSLTLLISIKYIIFVLRANNNGEGGVFALYALIEKLKTKKKTIFLILLMIAAGLLFGDGIITPAISVISSIEGLGVATNFFNPYIVLITVLILTGLFLIQSKGTSKVGAVFGPIIIVWFLSIAFFGAQAVIAHPAILLAFNPYYAINFLFTHSLFTVFVTLGAVMLAITGGEALYADLGHFGATPIRLSWFAIVYPSLMLNYLGQGAYILGHQTVINGDIFFSMIPHALIYPMVILATLATIIASQALISGAFSLTSQAISLGLFPLLRVVHTHVNHEGQIYVPVINWMLYIGCVLLVVTFQSSARLASAYGLAVSGVMLVTSLSMIMISINYWKWNRALVFALFIPFIIIDTTFLSSNSQKFIEGGYIPLTIGLALLAIMTTWKWGRNKVKSAYAAYPTTSLESLIHVKEKSNSFIPKTIIIMTPSPVKKVTNKIPMLKQLFLDRYGLLPLNIIFLTVKQKSKAYAQDERFNITTLYDSKTKGNISGVEVNFGFMEKPDVEKVLESLAAHHDLHLNEDPNTWILYIIQERMLPDRLRSTFSKIRYIIYTILAKNTPTADVYFGLGKEKHLSTEIFPVFA